MIGDLTTLAKAKRYLNIAPSTTTSDALLQDMITAMSHTVLNYVGRATFAVTTFSDVYDGNGKDWMLIRQWPVVEVLKVEVPGRVLTTPADTTTWPPSSGYSFDQADSAGGAQQRLTLWGGLFFPRGRSSTRVTYKAGYQTLGEVATVPASTPYQVSPQLTWLADLGVTYADGTPLTYVASAPAAGQYALVNPTPTSLAYGFAAADANAGVLLSYSSVPPDVDNAVQQWIAEDYRRMDRIGILSQAVGGQETVSYSQKDMGDWIQTKLNPFRRVTPT